jgi:hypothetical protein
MLRNSILILAINKKLKMKLYLKIFILELNILMNKKNYF